MLGIEKASDSNERLGQVGLDAHRVGIGQGVAGDLATNAHVKELARLRSQTRLDVAQALAVGNLREGHAEILIEAREGFDFVFAPITRYETSSRADAP